MSDVVREILLCLLIAAALGFAIGWLIRGLRARTKSKADDAGRRRVLEELRNRLRVAESARAGDERSLAEERAGGEAARREAEELRRRVREVELARDAARHDLAGNHDHQTKLVERLNEVEAARDAAKAEAAAAAAALVDARKRLGETEGQRDAARRDAAEQASRSHVPDIIKQHLDTLRATLSAAEAGWDTARAQAEAAFSQLGTVRHHLTESEAARAELAAELADVRSRLAETRSEMDEVRAPEPAVPPRGAGAATPPARPVRDDLQRIRGIGPVLERLLHRAGIERYAQIAVWTRQDIAAMDDRLPGFHGRIVRDRWPAAARRLHIAKYGSPP